MILYIVYLIGGILIGLGVGTAFWCNYINAITYGTLKQASDDGETYLFLDLDETPERILRRDRVVFRVDDRDMAPHE